MRTELPLPQSLAPSRLAYSAGPGLTLYSMAVRYRESRFDLVWITGLGPPGNMVLWP